MRGPVGFGFSLRWAHAFSRTRLATFQEPAQPLVGMNRAWLRPSFDGLCGCDLTWNTSGIPSIFNCGLRGRFKPGGDLVGPDPQGRRSAADRLDVRIHVKRIKGNWVRLCIDAPRDVKLKRLSAEEAAEEHEGLDAD